MYSQANVRAGKVLRPPIRALPSVIVDTDKVLREADGPVEMRALTLPSGGKVFFPGVRLESRSRELVRSPKNTSGCGSAKCKEAEATRKDFNIVLTHQDKKFFISELFKVIQDAIPLILHFRTMCYFRTISSSTFYHIGCAVSLHSITNSGLIPGGQNSSRERQTVFFTAVAWTRNTKIRTSLT